MHWYGYSANTDLLIISRSVLVMWCKSFFVNKTNRRTEFQFYWYDDSTRFRQNCIKCNIADVV
jgi:hypothetical protein